VEFYQDTFVVSRKKLTIKYLSFYKLENPGNRAIFYKVFLEASRDTWQDPH